MFHKAVDVRFQEKTILDVVFQDGKVKRYDMSTLFDKYPQLRVLEDRELFLSGRLMGGFGIIWNDDLDIEAETIYEDGTLIQEENPANHMLANAISSARAAAGMTQKEVSALAGIDQSDFSKIERGIGNPSISTLERIAKALGGKLRLQIEFA